jgi:Protein of unknown function (DUF1629)
MTKMVEPNKLRKAKQEFVYFIQPAWSSLGPGIDCINEDEIIQAPTKAFAALPLHMSADGFKPMSGLPVLEFTGKADKYHKDFEVLGGIWVLSFPVRKFFEEIDPGAFAFRECRTQYPDGSPAPPRSLARVTRIVDAFDRELSEFSINEYNPASANVSISPSKKNYFRKPAIGNSHFFYPAKTTGNIVVSQRAKDELKARGWRGAEFSKAYLI